MFLHTRTHTHTHIHTHTHTHTETVMTLQAYSIFLRTESVTYNTSRTET